MPQQIEEVESEVARGSPFATRYSMVVLGFTTGVFVLVSIAVAIRTSRIDMNDPSTWPNMGPGMSYFAIPDFLLAAAVPSIVVNWLFNRAGVRRVVHRRHWFALGEAYSLFAASYPLTIAGLHGTLSLFVGGVLAIGTAWVVRNRWGVHAVA
jgi:hypothetical protein